MDRIDPSSRREFLASGAALLFSVLAAADDSKHLLWQFDLSSPSYGGGSIGELNGESAIVFGTYYNDEHLYALRARDGKLLWKLKSESGPFDASVAIADLDDDKQNEVLAADSSTGTLFCLDGAGKVKWKYKLPSSTDSPPSVADLDGDGKPEVVIGTMTCGDRNGRVVALNPRTQKALWEARVPGHVQSEPVLCDLNVSGQLDILVTNWRGDKKVRALSGRDGSLLWSHTMKGDMYHGVSAFSADGVHVAIASIDGDVSMLDGAGKVIWSKQPGGYLFGPTTVADVNGDAKPELIVCGGKVHVFSLAGDELWRSPDYQSVPRGVAVANLSGKPALFFGAKDRKFRALDGAAGNELLAFDATAQGHVYEGIDSGPIIADFDGDGQLEAFFVTGKGTSDITQKQNYGRAYAVKIGPGKGLWPMFRGNLQRTGSA